MQRSLTLSGPREQPHPPCGKNSGLEPREPRPVGTREWQRWRPAHRSALQSGTHQHYLPNARETMAVKSGDTLYAYIYLDPDHPPQEVMLQWHDGDWNQRAYWGQNLINWGTNGTSSRRYMGRLPASGGWVRLEVPAAQVGLAGKTVNGLAFTLYGGRAWWDRAGVRRAVHEVTKYYAFNGQRIARRQDGVLTYLHTDHLGSTLQPTAAGQWWGSTAIERMVAAAVAMNWQLTTASPAKRLMAPASTTTTPGTMTRRWGRLSRPIRWCRAQGAPGRLCWITIGICMSVADR